MCVCVCLYQKFYVCNWFDMTHVKMSINKYMTCRSVACYFMQNIILNV